MSSPLSSSSASAERLPFADFFHQVFLPEHTHPWTVALHAAGTLASAAGAAAAIALGQPAWLILYPVVHAAPGLLAHRLFERNDAVGDLRVLLRDYPGLWFIAANHWLTVLWLSGRLDRARRAEGLSIAPR